MSEITGNILSNKILDGSITAGPIIAGDYIIYMSSIDGGNRLYVTKGSVTNHIDILDGDKGDKGDTGNKGDDGFSPYITITPIENGTRVTITDANGDHVFNVLDGIGDVNSVNGEKGDIVITPEKIGAIPNTVTIPEKITDLENDANYISKDDNDISSDSTWSSSKINQMKQDTIPDLENIRSKAINAVQMSSLSTVGRTGRYSDLLNKPNIPDELKDLQADYFHQTVSQTQINSWDSKQNAITDLNSIRSGASAGATAVQPTDIAPVATSGSYNDLIDKPHPIIGAVDSVNGKTGVVVLRAEDVGALPDTTVIPEAIADLTDDAEHRTVTDTEKETWNSKVDKNQGVSNYGKIMMVGDDGVVAPFDIYTPSYDSITEIARVVRSNTVDINARLFPVGDQIVVPWKDLDDNAHKTDETAYQVVWDIVRHGIVTRQDGSHAPGMFLQMHKCSAYGIQFSHQQAFFQAFSDVLTAGTYNVSFGVKYNDTFTAGTTGQFTLTQNLPIGGKLLLNGSKVEAWASATATTATESVDLTVGTDGTSLGSITSNNARSSDDLNAMYRILYGHNRWSTSGIRQYLNSADVGWFSSKEDFDIRPNEYAKHGFMAGFNSDFLNAISPVKVATALNTVENYEETTEDTFDTFFLPSLQQMNVTPQLANVEGDAFDYWKIALGSQNFVGTGSANIFDAFKIPSINNNSAQFVRLRSAYRGFACYVWVVSSSGYVGDSSASGAYRFSPVCVIC